MIIIFANEIEMKFSFKNKRKDGLIMLEKVWCGLGSEGIQLGNCGMCSDQPELKIVIKSFAPRAMCKLEKTSDGHVQAKNYRVGAG